MWRTAQQLAAIAWNTAKELIRNPAYAVLVGIGSAVTGLSPAFALFHLGEQAKMVADLGLGTTLVVALLVGVFGASWAVSEEFEGRSAIAILSKPVPRWAFLVGKYLGVLASAILSTVILGFVLLLTLRALAGDARVLLACSCVAAIAAGAGGEMFRRLGMPCTRAFALAAALVSVALILALDSRGPLVAFGRQLSGWAWAILPALAGIILQAMALAALAVALATRLPISVNLPVLLTFFVLGQIAQELRSGGLLGRGLGWLVPDIGVFQFSEAAAQQVSQGMLAGGAYISAGTLLWACAVAGLYAAGALAAGAALFASREVS